MSVVGGPRFSYVTDGLVYYVDAANIDSYVNGSTIWKDLTGNQNNGTLTNGPTFSSDGGGSIVFDGTNDRVDINISGGTISGLTYGTVSIWFKIPSNTPNISQNLFSLYESNGSRFGVIIGQSTSAYPNESLMVLHQKNGAISYAAVTNEGHTHYFDDTWHNIVLTIDSSPVPRTKVYMNNEYKSLNYPFGSNAGTGFTNISPIAIRIGDRVYDNIDGGFLDGNIGLIQIYNRALSTEERLQNYNGLKGRFRLWV